MDGGSGVDRTLPPGYTVGGGASNMTTATKGSDMSFRINATPGPWETTYIPVDLDPLAELGRMLEGGNGYVYYVCAPKHPDSNEDGVTVVAITGNGPTGLDNATAIACVPEMLEVIKLAYRKHHLGDDSVGWEELSEKLGDVLNNAMGPENFIDWLAEVRQ